MFLPLIYRTCEVFPVLLSRIYSQPRFSVPLVFTVESVAVQEALERHANPPKTLTNSFNLAMQITSQAQDFGRFGSSLTSIANHAFATCRLLLLRIPPDGALFPSHPIERDYRNVSVLTASLPVLSTQVLYIFNPMVCLTFFSLKNTSPDLRATAQGTLG
jgi:hypothetical protein